MNTQLTKEQVRDLTGNKRLLYDAMVRNKFFLPAYKSQIITCEWLMLVKKKRIWMPMYPEVRLAPCPNPPTKLEILDEMNRICEEKSFPFPVDKRNILPDRAWCIAALSTLDPDHRFFQKDYTPQKQQAQQQQEDELLDLIDNTDGFYSNLPAKSKTKSKSKYVKISTHEQLEVIRGRRNPQSVRDQQSDASLVSSQAAFGYVKIDGSETPISMQLEKPISADIELKCDTVNKIVCS